MATMPQQKPGLSKQDYQTPHEFLTAAAKRLGIHWWEWDLAADVTNTVVPTGCFYDETANSLVQDWKKHRRGWNWLNPPYADIRPWAQKAYESGTNVAMLVPASVGANWWKEWVDGKSYVLFLNGRLTFVGCDAPYPKDCALVLYTTVRFVGNEVWTWPSSLK